MSSDQTTNDWKGKNEKRWKSKKSKQDERKAAFPEHSFGQQELSDEVLEGIEGGAGREALGYPTQDTL